MKRFLARRLLNAVPVILIITFLVFLLTFLIPGDPASVMLGPRAGADRIEAVRVRMGLDEPFPERYLKWLSGVAQGDLGQSYLNREAVTSLISRALPVTLELSALALLVALLIAIPAGIMAALHQGSRIDAFATGSGFIGIAVPSFMLGVVLVQVFALDLKWLPATGYVSPTVSIVDNLRGMILPAITLGVFLSTQFMRYLRAGMLETMREDYVVTARAKGVPERSVVRRHIVRNALIPFVTVLGLQCGYLLGGAVIIEQIYALPGMGRLALTAVSSRDYQVVTGVVLVMALLFVLINLAVDILYSVLDPRVRLGGGRPAR